MIWKHIYKKDLLGTVLTGCQASILSGDLIDCQLASKTWSLACCLIDIPYIPDRLWTGEL